jgi:hypothetical protein
MLIVFPFLVVVVVTAPEEGDDDKVDGFLGANAAAS